MSIISTAHSLVPFDSKTSKAYEGQRLAKIGYKSSEGKPAKFASVCVSLPQVSGVDVAVLQAMKPFVISLLENAQDKIVREAYEAGAKSIDDSQVTIEQCIAWLDADAKGDRLTKEVIGEWFAGNLNDVLAVAIADKLGMSDEPTEAETKKLNQMLAVYKDSFASMAGGKTSFAPAKAEKMLKALEFASDDDVMVARIKPRLEKMMVQNTDADMLGL